ncbi:hypothetical protein [Pedobacter nototheniae]|uniref:hypothetical protein n=1 Tax=Pedobacter nototheniae TaxID=2488994 RepID=UPI001B8CFC70|nr:hypothetical protein [Pedobacter nototheniae]
MKTIIKHCFLTCIILLNIQCKAQQKTYNLNHDTQKNMIPAIDKNFEIFDSERYNRLFKKNPHYQSEFLADGTYIEMTVANAGKNYLETAPNSYLMISKAYFNNGNIKAKGLGFNADGFQKGIWYEFNENGQLIKETDYDKHYKFTFEDILKFCEREHIEVKKGPILQSTGFHTAIRRGYSLLMENVSWWEIDWLKRSDLIETIKLNGNTGVVVEKRERSYINN